jgi:hypothetical protein
MAHENGLDFLYADEHADPEQLCAALGAALGLDEPVPIAVMRRAIVDKTFAFYLKNCRGNPRLLEVLFADPRNERYAGEEPAGEQPVPPDTGTRSSVALAWQAGQAAARWGAAGFARVAPEVFEARFDACRQCEYLVEPPDRIVYKVRLRKESDPRVCAACGCVASRKAALPTESCPVADRTDPSLNRWGEPLKR